MTGQDLKQNLIRDGEAKFRERGPMLYSWVLDQMAVEYDRLRAVTHAMLDEMRRHDRARSKILGHVEGVNRE
jgi:hypothetical protein